MEIAKTKILQNEEETSISQEVVSQVDNSAAAAAAMQEIFDNLQQLSARLSNHIYVPLAISPLIKSQHDLISQINDLFKHQQQINQMQHSFATANYVTNLSNFSKTRKLEMVIARGQKEILSLTRTITTLRLSIESLNQDIESQRLEAKRLEVCLKDTQTVLKRAIVQYRKELDEQKALIESQGAQLDQLARSRFRADLLIDSGLFVIVLFLFRQVHVGDLISFMTRFLPQKARKLTKGLGEVLALFAVFFKLRKLVSSLGVLGSSNYLMIVPHAQNFKLLPEKPFKRRKVID